MAPRPAGLLFHFERDKAALRVEMTMSNTDKSLENKKNWVKPEVAHLAAGSAEDSSGPATDQITNPS